MFWVKYSPSQAFKFVTGMFDVFSFRFVKFLIDSWINESAWFFWPAASVVLGLVFLNFGLFAQVVSFVGENLLSSAARLISDDYFSVLIHCCHHLLARIFVDPVLLARRDFLSDFLSGVQNLYLSVSQVQLCLDAGSMESLHHSFYKCLIRSNITGHYTLEVL